MFLFFVDVLKMSWLTDIAGKAEDLLNRVDQTAATALQNKSKSQSFSPSEQYTPPRKDSNYDALATSSAFSTPRRLKSSGYTRLSSQNKQLYNAGISSSRKKSESDDEKLLKFLNETSTTTEERKSEKQVPSVAPSQETSTISNTNTTMITSKFVYYFFRTIVTVLLTLLC